LLEAWLTRVNYAQSAEIGLKTPFLVTASDSEKRKIVTAKRIIPWSIKVVMPPQSFP
jgi:hypothetical protein